MTSLLEEIKNEAIDANSDLSQILRKCKALAAKMQSQPLENWLLWESNRYPQDIDVPDYRSWGVALVGTFMSPTGEIIRTRPSTARKISLRRPGIKSQHLNADMESHPLPT